MSPDRHVISLQPSCHVSSSSIRSSGWVGAAVAVLHAMEHEHEHSEHEHSEHELHKWWLPFEAEKPQLADLGTWWQQFLMVAAVGVPLAIVYLCLFRQPSQLRRTFCLF